MAYLLLDWQNWVTLAVILAGAGWLTTTVKNYLRLRNHERRMRVRESRFIAAKTGPLTGQGEDKIIQIDETESAAFFRQRLQEKAYQERLHKQEQQRHQARERQIAQSLNSWAQAEQKKEEEFATLDLSASQSEQQSLKAKQTAADRSLLQWTMNAGDEISDLVDIRSRIITDQSLQQARDQIVAAVALIEKEANELNYMVTKLETEVDFVSLEFQDTLNRWKQGSTRRNESLTELKQRFRLKTLSIEDGWKLVFSYPGWVAKQRKQLADFVALLGTERQKEESIHALLDRAEAEQWHNDLEVNMDIIFLLQEVRKMQQLLSTMENQLLALETACRRRSEQIITPSWEPMKLSR